MAAQLVVFVCEGPTCSDRWGASAPSADIGRTLASRGVADKIALRTEICFGHCKRGPSLYSCPVDTSEGAVTGEPALHLSHPRLDLPGAAFHHELTIDAAVDLVTRIASRAPAAELAVAANRKLA